MYTLRAELFEGMELENIAGIPSDIRSLVSQYLEGDLGTFELMSRLEKARDSQRLSRIGIER